MEASRLLSMIPAAAVLLLAITVGLMNAGAPAYADSASADFENPPFVLGNINSQDGWSKTGPFDVAVVANSYGHASFGAQTLRISNAVTSGSFGDQTFSKSLGDEAGETDADAGGFSGGTRQPHFEAQWDFASAVPGAEQPGLSVVASPDRGDGARMSWVRMADTPGGIDISFYDYQRGATVDPLGCCPPFVGNTIVSGLDRTVPHTIKITMDLIDGDSNDIVKVYVDGTLVHTGTSWEDFFRDNQPVGPLEISRTVDSILFRVSGTAAPATSGAGFIFDNLSLSSGPSAGGHWPLDETSGTTVFDSSGNGNDGTHLDDPVPTAGGLKFDGDDDAVEIPADGALQDLDDLTVTLSFDAASLGDGDKGRLFVIEDSLKINFSNQSEYLYTTFERYDDDTAKWRGKNPGEKLDGTGCHDLAVTYSYNQDGTVAPEIYLDGVLMSNINNLREGTGTVESDAGARVFIGNSEKGNRGFEGIISDVKLFDRVLTLAEIVAESTCPAI